MPALAKRLLGAAVALSAVAALAVGCEGFDTFGTEDRSYPAWEGFDLDCPDVGREVDVFGADPHGLDGDNDGVGCEGY